MRDPRARLLGAAAVAVPLLLVASTATSLLVPAEPTRAVVDLAGTDVDELGAVLDRIGGDVIRVHREIGWAVVETPSVAALRAGLDTTVRRDARGRPAAVPSDPHWDEQWGPQMLDMPQAWEIEGGNRSVRVAVVDSGVDDEHDDLAGVPVADWKDFVVGKTEPVDPHGHGTHVAGIALATRDNGVGIAGMADVTLLAYRVLDEDGFGSCASFGSAIIRAVDHGADVINLSLYCTFENGLLHAAIDYARAHDVVVVASAGNRGHDRVECPTVPGRYPETIAVAAIDQQQDPASFTCRGAPIDVAAPGVAVWSSLPGDDYGDMSGTSMAAPHVTGTVALMLSQAPDRTAPDVRQRLIRTADDLGPDGPDTATGFGLVDPVEVLGGPG